MNAILSRDMVLQIGQSATDRIRMIASNPTEKRCFLLLQGPHGPFFNQLGDQLRASGATVLRVGFNAGDEFFWSDASSFIPYHGTVADWPAELDRLITQRQVTDIVLYGDVRGIHAAARHAARESGIILHVFEEGYLRPYWITYERGGANGFSPLMQIDLPHMRRALGERTSEVSRPPSHWGDMRHHKFYGALYHFHVFASRRRYPQFSSHRNISLAREFTLNLRTLLASPLTALRRMRKWRAIQSGGFPFALVLMQLEHDSSFLAHSRYQRMSEFTDEVLSAFVEAAPRHHHLVFKAHPLEDGRGGIAEAILRRARELGIAHRVHLIQGGKLASLLSQARCVITINSTAAQQALWRGVPVKAMGVSVYGKPGLVSDQHLVDFIRDPEPPQRDLYRDYRGYLLETCQVPGGFYSRYGRAHALRQMVDMMLAPDDPYATLAGGRVRYRQQMEHNL